MSATGLLAIDVGSSRVKLGWFPPVGECTTPPTETPLSIAAAPLPQPAETLVVSHQDAHYLQAQIEAWLQSQFAAESRRFMASVHPAAERVREILGEGLREITVADVPLVIDVEQPDRVGIDRVLNAVAVNRVRQSTRPAIVVDIGTACTVDWITADGTFAGGAILPGSSLAAAALHSGTASLPKVFVDTFESIPPVVGNSTTAAMASGLYWGMVGAVRELIQRMAHGSEPSPQLFMTGGGAPQLVTQLAGEFKPIRHEPHLVLAGIACVAEGLA